LLHVRHPFSQHVARFVSKRNRDSYHREQAEKALQPARDLLIQHSVPHASHIEVGDTAATIDRLAQRLRVDEIVMGTARKNTLTRLMEDSVTSKVLEIARVPVEVITGAPASRWERIGVPTGVGAAKTEHPRCATRVLTRQSPIPPLEQPGSIDPGFFLASACCLDEGDALAIPRSFPGTWAGPPGRG
jgi:K+-sensing histidine kinase KdpD